jgi:hypothetical protein
MRKLTLNLESLAVQSFETTPGDGGGRGTVLGRGGAVAGPGVVPRDTYPNGCPSPLCVDTPLASCDGSCGNSCYDSCNGSCASCIYSCDASCGGTCAETCPASCAPSCGPLCVPPIDPVAVYR